MFYVQCSRMGPNRLCYMYVCQLFGVVHGIAFLNCFSPGRLEKIIIIDIKSVFRQTYSQKWTVFDKIINITISEQKFYPIHVIFAFFRKKNLLLILTNFSSNGSV